MSLKAARTYFVNQMKLNKYVEHFDPFDSDNIPSTLLHKSFQVQVGTFTGRKLNQKDQEVDCPIQVKIFLKGYTNPADAIEKGLEEAESLCSDFLAAKNRLGNPVKNVILNRISPEAFATTNNSVVVVTMEFTVLTIFGIN